MTKNCYLMRLECAVPGRTCQEFLDVSRGNQKTPREATSSFEMLL